jgi:hypothetical protein
MAALVGRAARYRGALARLRPLRVAADAFFIWHADPFATINGARLGRVPGAVPEWAEVNAALGQMALLLSVTAARVGCVFSKWQLIPMGSFARLAPAGESGAGGAGGAAAAAAEGGGAGGGPGGGLGAGSGGAAASGGSGGMGAGGGGGAAGGGVGGGGAGSGGGGGGSAAGGGGGTGATLELWYDTERFTTAFFGAGRLSAALKAFFTCLAELGAFAHARDPSFTLPYAISPGGERVGELATALGKDVPWTRALRLAATDLKYLVSWGLKFK